MDEAGMIREYWWAGRQDTVVSNDDIAELRDQHPEVSLAIAGINESMYWLLSVRLNG
jgi:hypothetical protein